IRCPVRQDICGAEMKRVTDRKIGLKLREKLARGDGARGVATPQQDVNQTAMGFRIARVEIDRPLQRVERPVVVAEIDGGAAEQGMTGRIELVELDRIAGERLCALQRLA